MFNDVREFIQALEREGEVQRVKAEVDCNLEVGAITRRCIDLRAPAPLFEKIRGYPVGFSILGCPVGPTKPILQGRLALALGLPKTMSTDRLIEEFIKMSQRDPIPPRIVGDGPCKENILKGDEIDLYKFPVPFIHGIDGGRFIGSWHIDVTKDPDTNAVNWGMYRHQVFDKRTLGTEIGPAHHGMWNYKKYEQREEPMPIAIAIGTEPVSSIVSSISFTHPPMEPEITGAIRNEPVELVKCETVDLEVPATSEIVIEGVMPPYERRLEGPFGEYTGYDAGGAMEEPFMHVTCITHRTNPVLTISNMGKPTDEWGVISSIAESAVLRATLRQRGIAFKSLYIPPPGLTAIVSAKPLYTGYSHMLASAIWSTDVGSTFPYVIAVGDDVDVTNMEDVFWCLTTRMHPANGITVERQTPGHRLIPFLTPTERREGGITPHSHRALFDATFPYEWPKEHVPHIIDLEHAWPKEVRDMVIRRWHEYGYE